MKRGNIKGFTIKLFNYFVEFVYYDTFNLRVIAINKDNRTTKTTYLLDK